MRTRHIKQYEAVSLSEVYRVNDLAIEGWTVMPGAVWTNKAGHPCVLMERDEQIEECDPE